jgi:hypothetical protein
MHPPGHTHPLLPLLLLLLVMLQLMSQHHLPQTCRRRL